MYHPACLAFDCMHDTYELVYWGYINIEGGLVHVDIQYTRDFSAKFKNYMCDIIVKIGNNFLEALLQSSKLDLLSFAAVVKSE